MSHSETGTKARSGDTPWVLVVAAWLLVLMPLGWGVTQSVIKALPLFAVPATASAPDRS